MRAELSAIIVTDEVLFTDAGSIGRWRTSVASQMTRNSKAAAPVNSRVVKSRANAAYPVGSLRNLISTHTRNVTLRQFEIVTESRAPYSLYVIKGTSTIYAKSARVPAGTREGGRFAPIGKGLGGMYVPPGHGMGAMFRRQVRGQKANNFLAAGFDRTAARHSSLRGYSIS